MLTIEDELFVRNAEIIRRRALITMVVFALVSLMVVAFLAGCTVGFFHPPFVAAIAVAELQHELLRMTILLKFSLLLFLAIVLSSVVGVVVLIGGYARQTAQLVGIITQLNAEVQQLSGKG